jgi:hypothetical protein
MCSRQLLALLRHRKRADRLPLSGAIWTLSRRRRMTKSGPIFGSIHRTCLSPLVTDRSWYHPPLHERSPFGGSRGKLHRTTKILSHAARRRGRVAARGARAADYEAADHRVLGSNHSCGREPTGRRLCAALRELGWIENRTIAIEAKYRE